MMNQDVSNDDPACYGIACLRHNECARWHAVVGPKTFTQGTCRQPDGSLPMFAPLLVEDPMTEEAVSMLEMKWAFEALVKDAQDQGMVVTVEQVPLPPLAMGRYSTVVSVRKARSPA